MIAVDWGTTSFRAWRLDADGGVLDERHAAAGLLACHGVFEPVLARELAGWDDRLVVMAGMVGSRSGWREVAYVECPASLGTIAAGMVEVVAPSLGAKRVFIAPGVVYRPDDAPPDVMRGEETQLLGLIDRLDDRGEHRVCLPGTHSKWVRVCGGRIDDLRTATTGELYSLLRRHSLLAALMPPSVSDDADDADAFARGVEASASDGGLLHHLFGVRTLGLFSALDAAAAPSYLSGLLVGHELRALLPAGVPTLQLIGSEALTRRYARALALLGRTAQVHGEALGALGLVRLARARGLVDGAG